MTSDADPRVALLPLIDSAIRQISPLDPVSHDLVLAHATRRWRLMRQRRQIVRATSASMVVATVASTNVTPKLTRSSGNKKPKSIARLLAAQEAQLEHLAQSNAARISERIVQLGAAAAATDTDSDVHLDQVASLKREIEVQQRRFSHLRKAHAEERRRVAAGGALLLDDDDGAMADNGTDLIVEQALECAVNRFPAIFDEVPSNRKMQIARHALRAIIAADPNANGVVTRRAIVTDRDCWLARDQSSREVSIEQLLVELGDASVPTAASVADAADSSLESGEIVMSVTEIARLRSVRESHNELVEEEEVVIEEEDDGATLAARSSLREAVPSLPILDNYVAPPPPPAPRNGYVLRRAAKWFPFERRSFASFDIACHWVAKLMGWRKLPTHQFPTKEAFTTAFGHGAAAGMDHWYRRFNTLITEACAPNPIDAQIFISLLATASPNSAVAQNALNALLNFRALSQGLRPRHGTYPLSSLVNFLSGVLGRPSGAKVQCFLDNLVACDTSQRVTVDTHMIAFLFGNGRQSLAPWEYALLEEFYRSAAHECAPGILPHRFQSAVWHSRAGEANFTDVLLSHVTLVSFRIAPTPALLAAALEHRAPARVKRKLDFDDVDEAPRELQAESSVSIAADFVNALLASGDATRIDVLRAVAVRRVRELLLGLGYLSLPANDEADSDVAQISLRLFAPVRFENAVQLRATLASRRAMARRQGRELFAEEQREAERLIARMSKIGPNESVAHPDDQEWLRRDMALVDAALLSGTTTLADALANHDVAAVQDHDPYTRAHLHFAAHESHLRTVLRADEPGAILCDIWRNCAAMILN